MFKTIQSKHTGFVVMCKDSVTVVAFLNAHALILLSLAVTHYHSSDNRFSKQLLAISANTFFYVAKLGTTISVVCDQVKHDNGFSVLWYI